MFDTKVGLIEHTPTHTKLACMTAGKGINIEASTLNGFRIEGTLELKTESSRAEFIDAMKKAGVYPK